MKHLRALFVSLPLVFLFCFVLTSLSLSVILSHPMSSVFLSLVSPSGLEISISNNVDLI